MKKLIFTILTVLGAAAAAQNPKLKNVQFEVKDVGTVRIQHDVIGEPISQPERLEVFINCKNGKSYRVKVFRFCIWEDYSYEPGIKTLSLKIAYGRVDIHTGQVTCDRHDIKDIDLSNACN